MKKLNKIFLWSPLLFLLTFAQTALSAESIVTIEISGVEEQVLENVKGYLEIYQYQDKPGPSNARIRYMHRQANSQIKQSLEPFGYYKSQIQGEIQKTDEGWLLSYTVDPGEKIPLGKLKLMVTNDESDTATDDAEFLKILEDSPLKEGAELDHGAYSSLKKQLQVLASERGYFDAKFQKQQVRVHLPSYTASIDLHFIIGERYRLGNITFQQDQDVLADPFLQRYVDIQSRQDYESVDLQQLQSDLSNTDYFTQVEIQASPEKAIEADKIIPVSVLLTHKKPRKYTFGIGFGTDTGVRVKAGVVGRRVNRWGHNYIAEVLASQINYAVAGEYLIPAKDPRTDVYGLRASYEDKHSDTQDYTAFNVGGYYKFRDNLWIKTYALDYRVEEFELTGDSPTSHLLIPSVDWTRTYPGELEKRIYAVNGTWLQLKLRGGHESFFSDTDFIQPLVAAKWIHSLTDSENSSRIIIRGAMGTTWAADFGVIPTSFRYFSGGDRTVRGYEYNSIGPRDINSDVVGGKHLTEAGIEYEHPLTEKWGIAGFFDIGDAFDEKADYHAGVGLGVRWKSPIGPVRIDLGHALDQPPGDDIRLHLTIGPDL